jgi:hypothetical protein
LYGLKLLSVAAFVRMVLTGQSTKGLFDFVSSGSSGHA